MRLNRFLSSFFVALALTPLLGAASRSESCDPTLPLKTDTADGTLYYRLDNASPWAVMPQPGIDFAGKKVSFVYVIIEKYEPERSGAVVFKSGRVIQPGEEQQQRTTKNVDLVRSNDDFNNKHCRKKSFVSRPVTAKVYDDYHDLGGGSDILDEFHFSYLARRNGCRDSNNDDADSLFPYDPRSNRGQFSFDTRIVDGGNYIQPLAYVGATTAYASSGDLVGQRVEVRQYSVKQGTPTCFKLDIHINSQASFLRINDLESLSPRKYWFQLGRSAEGRWIISR